MNYSHFLFFFWGAFLNRKQSDLEVLLRKVRLGKAKEGDPKKILQAIMEELYHTTGHYYRRCWEMTLELLADTLGILNEPWRYSLPDLPTSPLFKGKIMQVKRGVPKDLAEHVRETGLVEEYIVAARAKPWDYIGDVFVEERLSNDRLGQMLTPKTVVDFMIEMLMTEYELKRHRAWVDAETVMWADSYTRNYGLFPLWARNGVEQAVQNIEGISKPKTILDPAVGTGRFLIEASLMYSDAPLVLFGIDIDVWMYRACLVNMALFSKHPYSIICANSLLLDQEKSGPSSPLWDLANLWEPADISAFYIKPPPATAESFNLSGWLQQIKKQNKK